MDDAEIRMDQLKLRIQGLALDEALQVISGEYSPEIVFSTSFGMEDQVITHAILAHHLPISIFTLDTGRMFPETYSTWERTNETYHTKIKAYYPKETDVEHYIECNGPNAFYTTPELRKKCCHIRKVEPLNRALKGMKIWITGLRAEQSPSREAIEPIEWDEGHQLYKFHPLLHWKTQEVKDYIKNKHIPYNPLHDRGFLSIGCAPCTRAIREGEDFRAGRWWWEDQSKKECGLHLPQQAKET